MTLQSLSAALRERRAASCGPQSPAAAASPPPARTRQPSPLLPNALEQRLLHIETDLQGLRRGLASVASAVRAVTRPLLPSTGGGAGSGGAVALLQPGALEAMGCSEKQGAQDVSPGRSGGAGVAAPQLQPRLEALEREAKEWRQASGKFSVLADGDAPGLACLADQMEKRLLSVINDRLLHGAQPKLAALEGKSGTEFVDQMEKRLLSVIEDQLRLRVVDPKLAASQGSQIEDVAQRLAVVETSQGRVLGTSECLYGEIKAVEGMAQREAELRAEQAQDNAIAVLEMQQLSEDLQLRLSTKADSRQESFEEAVSMAKHAVTTTSDWREKIREEAQIRSAADRRLNSTFQRFEQTLSSTVQAGLASTEKTLTAHIAEVEDGLRSEVSEFRALASMSEAALSDGVTKSMDHFLQDTEATFAGFERTFAHASQDASARCSSLERTLSAKIEAATSEVGSAAQASIARGMRTLSSEIACERKNREEARQSARKTEQAVGAQQQAHLKEMERLSEALAAGLAKCQKEDRGLWVRLREISRANEKLPGELREAAEKQVERAELRERQVRKDLQAHFETRARSAREESMRELRSELEASTRRCVEDVQEELRRELRGQLEAQAKRTLRASDESAEKRLETALAAQREQVAACARAASACELGLSDLQRRAAETGAIGDETRSELLAFMDEQRVFCGFLDTEQKSYYELLRCEVDALSRLVDSTFDKDAFEEHDPF